MALIISFSQSSAREDGQGLAEYALILALIAIVAIIALIFLGTQVSRHPEHRRRLGLALRPLTSEPAPPPIGWRSSGHRRPTPRRGGVDSDRDRPLRFRTDSFRGRRISAPGGDL